MEVRSFAFHLMIALHYKLTLENDEMNTKNAQIVYSPLFDPDRDEKILQLLPDYLTEDIMFAKEQGTSSITMLTVAHLFYWRLNQYLQKKLD
jgi:Chromosome segregation protein Csm1/Pcs1